MPRDDDLTTAGDQEAGSKAPGETSDDRDWIADDRDRTSEALEKTAEARDEKAEVRDDRAQARDRALGKFDAGAAADRAQARQDRLGAANDRARAAADRAASSSDRAASAEDRAVSSVDGLTGAHRRDAGLVELEREIARAKRTGQPFVLAFLDVDGLKATNDSLGHTGGDHLLRQMADTVRAHLRSYDLIVRFGGDEFVCGLLDLNMEEAARRFSLVNADLATTPRASFTVGLAELNADDSLTTLIARADGVLYSERQKRPSELV